MAITNFEACKKRKRAPNIHDIHNVGTTNQESTTNSMEPLLGPFRVNIREFLKQCTEREDYCVDGNPVWCTLLVSEFSGVVFPLYAIEENVKNSSQPFCHLCRCVGWSHHFVCKRNYHLIIPEDDKWNKPLKNKSLELETHFLHGVIHCNGFGHLLCINGIENNSKYLHGEELMNLWDHLCTLLQTREISVHDMSKKGTMDLRLLHGVAYGRSWFGKWGYKFCSGSFGVTEQIYKRAIDILGSLDLKKIVNDFINTSQGKLIDQIIQTYRGASETRLLTLSDLLRFMLSFKSKPPIQKEKALALASISSKKTTHRDKTNRIERNSLASFVAKLGARWPARRLEHAIRLILNILEVHGATMSRQDLRDAVRQHIGDTGLIDYILKVTNNVTIGNQFVCRAINPITKLIEFSLQDVADGEKMKRKRNTHVDNILTLEPGVDVYEDMLLLYKNVLLGYPDHQLISMATGAILDSKHFVKEWQFKGNKDGDTSLRLICRVRPSYDELANELTRPLPPDEIVVVPQSSTVDELKLMVQYALRDTFFVMDKFVVSDIKIGELEGKENKDMLICAMGQSMQVWVRGRGLDLGTKLRYQGGLDDWTVDCGCGARDDDGERMIACDVCHVWQHTRCNAFEDDEAAPSLFLCSRCAARAKH